MKKSLGNAKRLRRELTNGERVLWKKLRARRFHGLKFRRQVPLGPYIVDFLCAEKKLIIEIDGDSHFLPGAQERDRKREEYLKRYGFVFLRFSNYQTVRSVDSVLEGINTFLLNHNQVRDKG